MTTTDTPRAIPLKMPATMHHKTTAKRGMVGAAAVKAGVMNYAKNGDVGEAAMSAAITAWLAKDERDYVLKQKSRLEFKASQNEKIGGYLMLWLDRDSEALRCTCCPKYDAVAIPIRNHSPFSYGEMKTRARKAITPNLWCYWLKLFFLIIFFWVGFAVLCVYVMVHLRSDVGDMALVPAEEIMMRRRALSHEEGVDEYGRFSFVYLLAVLMILMLPASRTVCSIVRCEASWLS